MKLLHILECAMPTCPKWNKMVKYVGVVTLLIHTPLFKWYMIRLVVYNGHQKDMYRNDIRLRV